MPALSLSLLAQPSWQGRQAFPCPMPQSLTLFFFFNLPCCADAAAAGSLEELWPQSLQQGPGAAASLLALLTRAIQGLDRQGAAQHHAPLFDFLLRHALDVRRLAAEQPSRAPCPLCYREGGAPGACPGGWVFGGGGCSGGGGGGGISGAGAQVQRAELPPRVCAPPGVGGERLCGGGYAEGGVFRATSASLRSSTPWRTRSGEGGPALAPLYGPIPSHARAEPAQSPWTLRASGFFASGERARARI